MDVRQFNNALWQDQRRRELAVRDHPPGFAACVRRRLATPRYTVATRLAAPYGGSGRAVLDVGCGRGEMLGLLAPHFGRLVGIDIASDELERLRAVPPAGYGRAELLPADLNAAWPVADGAFDAVVCLSVFEHLFDPWFVAAELSRVLRPGGALLLEVPNIAYLKYRLSLLAGRFPRTSGDEAGWDGGHLHYFTLADIRGIFGRFGLTVTSVATAGVLAGMRSLWPTLFGADIVVLLEKCP